MREQILNLRSQGKSYSQIQLILNCAKSTVSYHCGERQKEKKSLYQKNQSKVRRFSDKKCEQCDKFISKYSSRFCSIACSNLSKKKPKTERQIEVEKQRILNKVKYSAYTGTDRLQIIRKDKLMGLDFDKLKSDSRRERVILEQDGHCNKCGLNEWLGHELCLELDHIDGDNTNNIRTNLVGLCPNCHSLTPTWRGRNCRRGYTVKLTPDDYVKAYLKMGNVRQALLSLGLAGKGGNYKMMYNYLDSFNISY